MDLKDKIIVITGAAKGLGKSLSLGLIKSEAKVVLSDIDKESLTDLENSTGSLSIVADVRKESDVEALAKSAVEKYGRIDIWINNAGIQIAPVTVDQINIVESRNLFDVNLFGTILGSKHALIQMKKQNEGIIINMASTAALGGKAKLSSYSASKYAIDGFTKSLRAELESSPIKIHSVFPGGTQTEIYNGFIPTDFETYMMPEAVTDKIIINLQRDIPVEDLIIKRPQ